MDEQAIKGAILELADEVDNILKILEKITNALERVANLEEQNEKRIAFVVKALEDIKDMIP